MPGPVPAGAGGAKSAGSRPQPCTWEEGFGWVGAPTFFPWGDGLSVGEDHSAKGRRDEGPALGW